MFGAAGSSPYARRGEWQTNVSFRGLTSDTHYRLDQRQVERETLGTYVINRQHAVDVNVTYAVRERFSLSAAVPFINASWSIPSPIAPAPGPRAQEDGRGIGDVSVSGRYWLLNTQTHRNANIAIGCGFKMPTGNYRAKDTFPDISGQNTMPRYVDQSVQPGDGGWGLMFDVQGFKRIGRRAQIFGSGNYLANPRDTNGTPSIAVSLARPGAPPSGPRTVNSVPDQYLARVGGSMAVGKRMALMTAYRVEGQRRYDLIGGSHGFRRPGVSMFVEPGVTIVSGTRTFSFTVPIAFYRDRKPDPYTGLQGDATFPRYIFMASYGWRFGGPKAQTGPRTTAKPCN